MKRLRKNGGKDAGLVNKYKKAMALSRAEFDKQTARLQSLQGELAEADQEQSRLERQLYRIARSFLLDVLQAENGEQVLNSGFQHQLALVADMGRSLLRKERRMQHPAT